jgi:hypothetical protein
MVYYLNNQKAVFSGGLLVCNGNIIDSLSILLSQSLASTSVLVVSRLEGTIVTVLLVGMSCPGDMNYRRS